MLQYFNVHLMILAFYILYQGWYFNFLYSNGILCYHKSNYKLYSLVLSQLFPFCLYYISLQNSFAFMENFLRFLILHLHNFFDFYNMKFFLFHLQVHFFLLLKFINYFQFEFCFLFIDHVHQIFLLCCFNFFFSFPFLATFIRNFQINKTLIFLIIILVKNIEKFFYSNLVSRYVVIIIRYYLEILIRIS